MQHVFTSREEFYDNLTSAYESDPVDVQGSAMIVLGVTIHSLSGSGPQLDVTLQTSDDLETWSAVGSPVSAMAVGWSGSAVIASSTPIARYVRVLYDVLGSTPLINATVAINTFRST